MEKVTTSYGMDITDRYDAVVNLMDAEITEELHKYEWDTEQDFYNAYCIMHEERYGNTFSPDDRRGQW